MLKRNHSFASCFLQGMAQTLILPQPSVFSEPTASTRNSWQKVGRSRRRAFLLPTAKRRLRRSKTKKVSSVVALCHRTSGDRNPGLNSRIAVFAQPAIRILFERARSEKRSSSLNPRITNKPSKWCTRQALLNQRNSLRDSVPIVGFFLVEYCPELIEMTLGQVRIAVNLPRSFLCNLV